jgi:ABC-type antimicrobial peptide transport system permease subunit
MTLTQRDSLSCLVLRLANPAAFSAVDLFTKQRLDLELRAVRESTYYANLSGFYAPIRTMTWVTAALIATGAIFGGFNMLYAAFASRIRELGTLQAIGYTRSAVFLSLLQESLLATLSGTLLAAFAAVFFLEGQSVYFSMGTFHLTLGSGIVTSALLTGVLLGLLGVIPPAIRCLGAPLPAALRS